MIKVEKIVLKNKNKENLIETGLRRVDKFSVILTENKKIINSEIDRRLKEGKEIVST